MDKLVGREGNIMEICYHKDETVSGAWIALIGEPFLDEQEWFIPANSFVVTKPYEKCLSEKEAEEKK